MSNLEKTHIMYSYAQRIDRIFYFQAPLNFEQYVESIL
jgi:hypothetical protein